MNFAGFEIDTGVMAVIVVVAAVVMAISAAIVLARGAEEKDLTNRLRGVTRPITLDVTYNASQRAPWGAPIMLIGFSARGAIPRSQFGINEMTETPGAKDGVADAVQLQIEAVFQRPIEGEPSNRQPAEPVN